MKHTSAHVFCNISLSASQRVLYQNSNGHRMYRPVPACTPQVFACLYVLLSPLQTRPQVALWYQPRWSSSPIASACSISSGSSQPAAATAVGAAVA